MNIGGRKQFVKEFKMQSVHPVDSREKFRQCSRMDINDYFKKYNKVRKEIVDKNVIKVMASFSNCMDLLSHECPICYDVYQKHDMIATGECNHMFCKNCTDTLCNKRTQFSCPLCRTNVTKIIEKANWRNPEKSVSLKPKIETSFGRLIVLYHEGLLLFLFT